MKKSISKLFAIILSVLFLFQASLVAFADDAPDWVDANWSQEEFEEVLSHNPNSQITTFTSGLITRASVGITYSGTTLEIGAITQCANVVVKCGFTVVTVKKRTSSSASWTTYKTYEDLYTNSNNYYLQKTLTVPTGYQWRVYCTHYAKKSLLSTEKIENASNIVLIK